MTYLEFIKSFNKKAIENSYLLTGAEDYLIEDCLQKITHEVISPDTREFNLDVFYAGQADAGQILDAASAYPMLSDSRLVVVKNFNKMAPSGVEAIAKYLKKPAPTTKLVLVCEKLGGRAKAYTSIKKSSCFVECKTLYDNQIPDWIKNFIQKQGLAISYNACLLIQAHVGNNLRALANEIDKIKLNISGEKIEEEDVQRVVGFSRSFSVFELNDALGNRQKSQALTILNKMLESGESHTAILAMVSRHFITLLKVAGAATQGKSQGEIASLAGIPPFFVQKTKAMAIKFKRQEFEEIFNVLLETDLTLKTSQQKPIIALQTMVLKILK